MSEPTPEPSGPQGRPSPPPDEESANAYADGYGEGLREAFREVLQHASRGHTAQELRILIESRLARLREDVEVKRRSLLAPPRRPSWGPLLRPPLPPPTAAPWTGGPGTSRPPGVPSGPERGTSLLVREERPANAVELTISSAPAFARVVWVSVRPASDVRVPREKLVQVRVGSATSEGRSAEAPGDLSEVAGRVREATKVDGGALVYLDALEFMTSEYGVEPTVRFINFLTNLMAETGSALIVSADPHALEARDQSRLQKAFTTLA